MKYIPFAVIVGVYFLMAAVVVGLSGCGMSQKQLREVDNLLTQAQSADCELVKGYLGIIQREVKAKLDK